MLPSTPLEAPVRGDDTASYLDYWPRQLEANPALLGAADLAASTRARSRAISQASMNCPPKIVEKWDARLGPFNNMQGGTDVLLLGATKLLRANSRRNSIPQVRYWENCEETTDEFLDATDSLEDMADQRPSTKLLLAGQLVCKAAWTYDDLDRREDLFGIAARMYRRIHESDKPWDNTTFKAGQYLFDLDFHYLSTEIRHAKRTYQDLSPFQQEAIRLLDAQGNDILRQCSNEGGLSGEIFEPFSSYVARNEIYLDPGIKGNHPEVRTAFASEDNPAEPIERTVNSKFDLVLDRFTSNGQVIGAEPWQMKLGKDPIDEKGRPYHPAIRVVIGEGISQGTMIDVVRGIKRAHAGQDCRGQVRQIAKARRLFEPLIARPKKAA